MLEEVLELMYWRIILFFLTLRLKTRLTWNRFFNPWRYATLLYAIPMMLGANPQEQIKCENALLRLPYSARRHIHDLCVKALIPDAGDEFCEKLFRHYVFGVSPLEGDCPNAAGENKREHYKMNRLGFYKGMAQIGECVNAELKKIPYEHRKAINRKQRKEREESLPTCEEFIRSMKERYPEYPPEFWIPFDQAIERKSKP